MPRPAWVTPSLIKNEHVTALQAVKRLSKISLSPTVKLFLLRVIDAVCRCRSKMAWGLSVLGKIDLANRGSTCIRVNVE